ncbi:MULTISPECIES: LytTR family DNA-binding domain-containing protein [unclassified Spirosoma]|uniref:LytR/AlgR family response regulator transcription factor n=1 Tax=unclassified Spirosoma TaxID=2621999 RepID=UPI000967A38C|nr:MULTISPECIES: LytTR family DNA-binding domain-containing protein [unclassified Spirosoma]MBN8824524.1 response regulator transcription factor [Spirosoma sp.]OJW70892.1 MAG: DNA-binding response regulator [Spirosoma sp. 48-14]
MRTIIIDDEQDNVRLLTGQLKRHCPTVTVVGQFTDSSEGLAAIQQRQPQLVFLDIEMPIMNGFQLLERVGAITFQIVFVTAYDQYALQAFRFSALDYLLKPVDTIDLLNAVRRAELSQQVMPGQLDLLRQFYGPDRSSGTPSALPSRLALPQANGLTFVEISNILYVEAEGNYALFVMKTGERYLVSKTLSAMQEMLESRNFLRVHRQYIVNLDHIRRLVRGEGMYLVLSNEMTVPVARPQKERLLERFGLI